ncbi:MAG: transcriptional regulator [Pyrinomonadaceae bacterium]
MNGHPKAIYEFGEYRLIPSERELLKNGTRLSLPPKAFDILVVLVENAGELVDNKVMMNLVWPDSFVEEANIQVQISAIRKVLGESGNRHYIETVPKTGYRFIAEVEQTGNGRPTEKTQVPLGNPK